MSHGRAAEVFPYLPPQTDEDVFGNRGFLRLMLEAVGRVLGKCPVDPVWDDLNGRRVR